MSRDATSKDRSSWPVRRYRLGEEPSDDLSDVTTPEQRIDMVWRLTLDAWASQGIPMPEYDREDMPGRVIRPTKIR